MKRAVMIAAFLAVCGAPAQDGTVWLSVMGKSSSEPTPPSPPVEATPFLWLDATDTPTITTNSSGRVSAWNSVSPATNNATQTTEADKPYWRSSAINGKATIEATGGNQHLNVHPFHIKPLTIFAVVRFDVEREGVILSGGRGYFYTLWWWGWGGNFFTLQNEDTIGEQITTTGNYLIVWSYDGSTARLRVNGQVHGSIEVEYEAINQDHILGAWYNIIIIGSQAHYGEMRAFDSILPLAQIEAIEAELTTKWGL